MPWYGEVKSAKHLIATVILASVHLVCGQYLQIYPERDAGNGTTHLYFGLMQSVTGDFSVGAAIPGVQVALDQINEDPDMLPGYTLHYTLSDSKVSQRVVRQMAVATTANFKGNHSI